MMDLEPRISGICGLTRVWLDQGSSGGRVRVWSCPNHQGGPPMTTAAFTYSSLVLFRVFLTKALC